MSEARVGPVDLVHFAPHVLEHVASVDDLSRLLLDDTEGFDTELRTFFASGEAESVNVGFFELSSQSDESSAPSGLARRMFWLWEILAHIALSLQTNILRSTAPSERSVLLISPPILASHTGSWLELDPALASLAPNFYRDMTVVLESPFGERTQHALQFRDGSKLLVTDELGALEDGIPARIVGVLTEDPFRAVRVRAFHAWRGRETPEAPESMTTFNEQLYKLLYAPLDPALSDMTAAELHEDYLEHPDRISSAHDLANVHMHTSQVDSRLVLRQGASLEWEAPYAGAIDGIIKTAMASFVVPDVDRVLPTLGAVRALIGARQDVGAKGELPETIIEGVLYAGQSIGGVHCSSSLTVNLGVGCRDIRASHTAFARDLSCERFSGNEVLASTVTADALQAGSGALTVNSDSVRVRVPVTDARAVRCSAIDVAESATVAGAVSCGHVDAGHARVTDSVTCERVYATDMYISSTLEVGEVFAAGLICGGLDLLSEVKKMRRQIDDLADQVKRLT